MEGTEDLEMQVPRNSPAYGAWNVSIVAAGTGDTLPGPVICEMRAVVNIAGMVAGSGGAL
jgi:hypothetical protein